MCCFVSWNERLPPLFIFLLVFVCVYHSKWATKTSLWKRVYSLPPHMFAVSLCRRQASNERLLLGKEIQAFYLSPPVLCQRSPSILLPLSSSSCPFFVRCLFSYDSSAGKHDANFLSSAGSRGVLEQQQWGFFFVSVRLPEQSNHCPHWSSWV